MKIIGIDENGFGSLTGPLIITGTSIKSEEGKWFASVCDSKKFFSSRKTNNFKKLEEFVISLYYCIKRKLPESSKEVINFFSPDFKCSGMSDICSVNIPDNFIWADIEKGKKQSEKFIEWMEKEDVSIKDVKSKIICAKKFNELIKNGNSKFIIDLFYFCEILKEMGREDYFVYAGKIGSMRYYSKYLRYFFSNYEIYPEIEEEKKSIYVLNGRRNFKLGFFFNVEEVSFASSISSIVGKYIREIFMESFRKSTGIEEKISGYRDKKTKRVISNLFSFPQECVLRIK